jgi:hypothetical protein
MAYGELGRRGLVPLSYALCPSCALCIPSVNDSLGREGAGIQLNWLCRIEGPRKGSAGVEATLAINYVL